MVVVVRVTAPAAQGFRLAVVEPVLFAKELCPARLLRGLGYSYFRGLVRSLVRLVQVGVGKEMHHPFVARSHGTWAVSSGTLIAFVFSVDYFVTQGTGDYDSRATTVIAHLVLGSTRLLRRRVGDVWERARP